MKELRAFLCVAESCPRNWGEFEILGVTPGLQPSERVEVRMDGRYLGTDFLMFEISVRFSGITYIDYLVM